MRSKSLMAQGFSEMKESGPASITKPSVRSVAMAPPSRLPASRRVSWTGLWRSRLNSTSRCAAARPAIPPPMTTMRRAAISRSSRDPPLHHVRQGANKRRMIAHSGGAHKVDPGLLRDLAGLDIEVVQHLDMIAHEADGHRHHVPATLTS